MSCSGGHGCVDGRGGGTSGRLVGTADEGLLSRG